MVAALSHPVARGGVGERSAPRPLRRKPNSSPERPHQLRRKPKSPPEQPRESARGSHPLAPRPPMGCRGAERPTPASSEAKFFTRTPAPAPSKTQIPARTAPGERERVAALSHPAPRGDVGERSAPRPFRRKPNSPPEQSNLPRWKSKFPPAQPRESARGCEPSRTLSADKPRVPSDSSPSLYQPCGKDASNPDTNRAYPRAFHVRPPPYPTFSTIYPQPPVWKILKNCRFTLE